MFVQLLIVFFFLRRFFNGGIKMMNVEVKLEETFRRCEVNLERVWMRDDVNSTRKESRS